MKMKRRVSIDKYKSDGVTLAMTFRGKDIPGDIANALSGLMVGGVSSGLSGDWGHCTIWSPVLPTKEEAEVWIKEATRCFEETLVLIHEKWEEFKPLVGEKDI